MSNHRTPISIAVNIKLHVEVNYSASDWGFRNPKDETDATLMSVAALALNTICERAVRNGNTAAWLTDALVAMLDTPYVQERYLEDGYKSYLLAVAQCVAGLGSSIRNSF